MCRKCWEGVIVKLRFEPSQKKSPADCDGDPCDEGFRPVALYPAPPKLTAPEHVPPATTQDYKEAMDSLWRQNWTSAGIMFRKVLERSTMEISPDGVDFGKMTLSRRIDALADRHKITPAMKDWADLIRLEGIKRRMATKTFPARAPNRSRSSPNCSSCTPSRCLSASGWHGKRPKQLRSRLFTPPPPSVHPLPRLPQPQSGLFQGNAGLVLHHRP